MLAEQADTLAEFSDEVLVFDVYHPAKNPTGEEEN